MKDIPVFTSEFGIATLILSEIPYKRRAYVVARSAQEGKLPALLEECRAFCVAAGAESVCATVREEIEIPVDFLPHAHDMLWLYAVRNSIIVPFEPVELVTVDDTNGAEFLRSYNMLFYDVPNSATYTDEDLRRIAEQGRAYLALVDGEIAGIGEVIGNEICSIGVLPSHQGLGERLMRTLVETIHDDIIKLQVSTANPRAKRLYERMGFGGAELISQWYWLLKEG